MTQNNGHRPYLWHGYHERLAQQEARRVARERVAALLVALVLVSFILLPELLVFFHGVVSWLP